MLRPPRRRSVVVFVVWLTAGCGQPVREDRTIAWSAEGTAVGFQHGMDGVFLADPKTGACTRIFQPDKDVLASSTPLWSPTGSRAIFMSARSADQKNSPIMTGQGDAAGSMHFQHPVVYTCWLHDGEARNAKPVALFDAPCDHVGYVAANLAVRWHPRGDRIYFLKQAGPDQHRLYEFDLKTRQIRDVSPTTAPAMIFDVSPDGKHLGCVVGSPKPHSRDGLWICRVDGDDWWEVPASWAQPKGELPSLIEGLREARPVWNADGTRFAFVTYHPPATPTGVGEYLLQEGTVASKAIHVLARGPEPYRQMHWSPDDRLGTIVGTAPSTLCIIDTDEVPRLARSIFGVRCFAGWDCTGRHYAYTTPEAEDRAQPHWALLFAPDPLARDTVVVAADGAAGKGEVVLTGMQVTFLRWSPKESKLSLWLTFVPKYRWAMGGRLRPGDPAAVFDVKTASLTWVPVNAFEKSQVGHYYLLKREYAEAARWYAEAEKDAAAAATPRPRSTDEQDFRLFHYYCLNKLGRTREAEARLAEFRFALLAVDYRAGTSRSALAVDRLDPTGLVASFTVAAYAAEVFLSLDAAEDGEAFLRNEFLAATTDRERLSRAVVLGQILLVRENHQEYAELMGATAAPLLVEALGTRAPDDYLASIIAGTGALALAPLASPNFVAGLGEDAVRRILPRLEALRSKVKNEALGKTFDGVLYAMYRDLGMERESKVLEAVLKAKGRIQE